jgi:hypothetical protein
VRRENAAEKYVDPLFMELQVSPAMTVAEFVAAVVAALPQGARIISTKLRGCEEVKYFGEWSNRKERLQQFLSYYEYVTNDCMRRTVY